MVGLGRARHSARAAARLPQLSARHGRVRIVDRPHLFSVGHGRRPLEDMLALLTEHGVTQLMDVRHYPRSRRNPAFNLEALTRELPSRGVTYVWLGEELGGLRKGGYEDWMECDEFQRGLGRLEQLAAEHQTAIMCAETLWVRCHRRFIARALAARGFRVTHITHVGKPGSDEPLSLDIRTATLALQDGYWSGAGG